MKQVAIQQWEIPKLAGVLKRDTAVRQITSHAMPYQKPDEGSVSFVKQVKF